MPKQVKASAPEAAAQQPSNTPQNLYVSVKTFDVNGKTVGERIVDMHHYGTSKWLFSHIWWASHHECCTEIDQAKPGEIEAYLAAGKEALAAKFNAVVEPVVQAKAA